MSGVVVFDGPDGMPVRYGTWTAWRADRGEPIPFVPYAPVANNWCFTCSRRGYIKAPVRRPNGELIGYRREDCPTCEGRGYA